MSKDSKRSRIISFLIRGIVGTVGFMLSPLSWWNDLVINVPLAYIISMPFSFIHKQLFLPAFITAYWLTNLVGLILLHWGGEGLVKNRYKTIDIKHSFFISVIYSVVILIMVMAGWLLPPSVYLQNIS